MKRVVLSTTSLVVAGGMAAADVSVSGSAELGVSGAKGSDAKLHKDIDVNFGLSGSTDTGLSFGASIDLDEAAAENDTGASTYDAQGHVFISGAFGTLTLGDTDGAFDKALTEVGSGGAIADNHTGHPGYDGNSGLDGGEKLANNSGNILRYDYSLGGVTTSVSGEFGAANSSDSALGVGVAWSGDVGGIGMGIGLGFQNGRGMNMGADPAAATDDERHKASILGMSASADMGNGFSVVGNFSSKKHDIIIGTGASNAGASGSDDANMKITHTAIGIAYSVGDLTVAANAGTKKTMVTGDPAGTTADANGSRTETNSGVGVSVVYSLGSGVSFQVGVGSGNEKTDILAAGDNDTTNKVSSWSAGLAFSF